MRELMEDIEALLSEIMPDKTPRQLSTNTKSFPQEVWARAVEKLEEDLAFHHDVICIGDLLIFEKEGRKYEYRSPNLLPVVLRRAYAVQLEESQILEGGRLRRQQLCDWWDNGRAVANPEKEKRIRIEEKQKLNIQVDEKRE